MSLITLNVTCSCTSCPPEERCTERSRDASAQESVDVGGRGDEASAGVSVRAGDPVPPVGPTAGSLARLIVPQALLSALVAVFVMMVTAFISRLGRLPSGAMDWEFLSRFLGRGYRENAPGLMGVVAGLVVALAALSWSNRKRPEDSRYLRAWLVGVLDDARRERITAALMLVLAMFAGALVILFWVGVLAAPADERDVMSEAAVGVALTCVAGVIFMLPFLLQNSGSGALSGYVGVVRELLAFAEWRYERGDRLGLRGVVQMAGSVRMGERSERWLLAAMFLVVALLCGAGVLIYASWRGVGLVQAAVIAAVAGLMLGVVTCYVAWMLADALPAVVVGASVSRVMAILQTFMAWMVHVLAAFGVMFLVVVASEAKKITSLDFSSILVMEIVILPLILHLLFGWRVPILKELVDRRICVAQERRVRTYRDYFSTDPERDADKRAIMDVLVPVGAVLVAQGRPSRWTMLVGMRAWTHRAELRYPSASVTGRDAREYFATEFQIDGNG